MEKNLKSQIQPMAYAEITLPNQINNIQNFKTNIFDMQDDKLYIYPPVDNKEALDFSSIKDFSITVFTKKYLLKYEAIYIGEHKEGRSFLNVIKTIGKPKKIQRREFFRIEHSIPISFKILECGEPEEESNDIEDSNKTFKAYTHDLSASGMRFNSNTKFTIESIAEIHLKIGDNEISVTGVIVDRLKNNKTNSLYQYRIRFVKVNNKTKEEIIDYVWKEQQVIQTKKLGNISKHSHSDLNHSGR